MKRTGASNASFAVGQPQKAFVINGSVNPYNGESGPVFGQPSNSLGQNSANMQSLQQSRGPQTPIELQQKPEPAKVTLNATGINQPGSFAMRMLA